jgi:hypothetical protein
LAVPVVALEALGVVTGTVAHELQKVGDVHSGAFSAIFSAALPWPPEQLRATANGTSIKLAIVS